MKKDISNHAVYPGRFVPNRNEKEVVKELKQMNKKQVSHPLANISELPDLFKLELMMPGMKREEIVVNADKNVVLIRGTHKKEEQENAVSTDNRIEGLYRRIVLPESADTEFACAEYKSGVLCIHVPKTKRTANSRHAQIAVY